MSYPRRSDKGFSLIEALVASAVLCVTVLAALMVYDASRKAFAKSENATEQQESVRIAFDKLTTDLRMLGYNFNPDGSPSRPDEQLEGALDHAVIVRADFDRSDPAASVTPETTLAGGAFTTVSTGNDEIVAYVLAKPDGTGPDTITFQADVRETPRDGVVEPVVIDNVVLNPISPPYTLYRVTLNNDARTYGTRGFVVRTPVIENVRDVSFTYYNDASTFKDATSSIAETAAAVARRSSLTRVNVSLVGMTRQQDFAYTDPLDAAAPHYRKFELKGDVTPRNMHLEGTQDLNADVTPPSRAAMPTLIPGHCGGLLVIWAPNPAPEGVVQYRISWGQGVGTILGRRNVPGSPYFLDGLAPGETYLVWIQAQDAQPNLSASSDTAPATVTNVNTPNPPAGLTTSTDQTYHVAVRWASVTANTTSDPADDPQAPRIRDLAGYRLYWNPTPTFPADRAMWKQVGNENVFGPSFNPPYLDAPVVACLDRYYRLTAVDTCGKESEPTPVNLGRAANTGIRPNPASDVQAQFESPGAAHVRWRTITQDVNGENIRIDRYDVFRSDPVDGLLSPSSAVWGPAAIASVTTTEYVDPSVPALTPGQVVYYRVKGTDSCGNESNFSQEARLDCTFTGTVGFLTPTDGGRVSGAVRTTVTVAGGSDSYVGVTITYARGGVVSRTWSPSMGAPGPPWSDAGWSPTRYGWYTIRAEVTNATGCKQSSRIDVEATDSSDPMDSNPESGAPGPPRKPAIIP